MPLTDEERTERQRERCRRYYQATKDQRREHKSAYNRAFYQANREQIIEKVRAYRAANSELLRERGKVYKRRYKAANRSEYLARERQRYWANRERELERSAQYRFLNKEEIAIKAKFFRHRWYQSSLEKNRLKSRLYENKRRAAMAGAILSGLPEVTPEAVLHRFALFGNSCAYCGSTDSPQQEHVVPLAAGGHHTPANIVPACAWCNMSKKDRPLESWYRKQSFFSQHRLGQVIDACALAKPPASSTQTTLF